ncbi:MAG: DegT/DnrJ/EryC1/StrS family aminotransferase [Solirubrobacteraceae bacterium]
MSTSEPQIPLTSMDNDEPGLLTQLLEAVEVVAGTGSFIGGEVVERFELSFARHCHTRHAVGVSSGTEALTLTLRALGIESGDEVIVPANSFVATAEAVCLAGGHPRFADVDPRTQLVTAGTLQAAHTPRVRAVIVVHLFGRTVQLPPVLELTRRWGAALVEDCAQAHGARYGGRSVGSWGDAGTFSFYPAKNLGAWGDGGAVVTDSDEIAERVRLLRTHGESPRHHHRIVGTTARLDAIQAAVLERKLPRLEKFNAARRTLAGELREALADIDSVLAPPGAEAPADHVYHQFVVRVRARDAFRAELARRGIATGIHYPVPIHRTEAFAELAAAGTAREARRDVAPAATMLADEICSLPMFPTMRPAQLDRLVAAIREVGAGLTREVGAAG